MTAFKLVLPPAVEPVSVAEAKTQARIDTTADDALIADLITGARQWAEAYMGRALITQTWQLWLDLPPGSTGQWWDGVREGPVSGGGEGRAINLPRAPLQSVTSVQSFADDDSATVWSATNYFVDTVREPGRLALRLGAAWPAPTRNTNGIMIQYVAGYGDDGSAVPEPIRTAMRQLVAHWYEHRGEAIIEGSARRGALNVPLIIEALLNPYRIRNTGF